MRQINEQQNEKSDGFSERDENDFAFVTQKEPRTNRYTCNSESY